MTEQNKLFHIPQTLDEILLAITFVAWPFLYVFLLRPRDVNTAADVFAGVIACGIQVGIAFAMKTAQRRGGTV